MRRLFLTICTALRLGCQDGYGADLLPEKDRLAAQQLYVSRCTKCHDLFDPNDYTQKEWQRWMTKMGKKAKLTREEQQLLNRYRAAYQSQQPPAKVGATSPPRDLPLPAREVARPQESSPLLSVTVPNRSASQGETK